MPNDQLLTYINSQLAKGVTKESVINSLMNAGWSSAIVSQAFETLSAIPLTNILNAIPTSIIVTEKDYPITLLWIFKAPIIFILMSLIALVFGYYFPYIVIALPYFLIANPLIRANFHYSVEDKFFVVKQGVISKKLRNLPYGVIQNVLVKQDLFDKIFGLSTLTVENASEGGGKGIFSQMNSNNQQGESVGSKGNKVNIPGLKKKDAEALKLVLLEKMKANPNIDTQSGL